MQQPQSSSTLNNYISNCQNCQNNPNTSHQQQQQQSSSSCVECQHINRIQQKSVSQSSQQSSSHDDGELVQPLHRHIVEHSRHIEATITQLQMEIQKLKNANSSKDVLIEQLRKELKQVQVNSKMTHSLQQNAKEAEFLRRQQEIQKIRKELYESSQHLMKSNLISSPINNFDQPNDQDSINERELKRRLKKVEVMFEDKTKGTVKSQGFGQQRQKKIDYSKKVKVQQNRTDSQEQSSDEENHQGKQRRPSYEEQKNRQKHPIKNLSQENKNTKTHRPQPHSHSASNQSSIQQQLNQHYQKITRLQTHIQFCQEEMLWMTNFIIAFLKMNERMMASFGQPVLREEWNLKKKTKIAWRYTKHVLGYLLR